jgi:translation initiation factor 1 (eIF-1/SUI1)
VFFVCGTMNFVSDIVPFQLQEKQEVVIEKIVRNKRKCVTVVKGLELFGELFSEKKFLRVKWLCQGTLEWAASCISNQTLLEPGSFG